MASMENLLKDLLLYAISINKNAFKIDDFLMTRRYDDARESKIQLIQHLKESNLLFTISINDYNPAIVQINKDVICLICKSIKEVLRSFRRILL